MRTGSLLFVAGHGPFVGGKIAHTGKLGAELTVEAGRKAAEVTTMNILGTLKAELGELSRISRFVRLLMSNRTSVTTPARRRHSRTRTSRSASSTRTPRAVSGSRRVSGYGRDLGRPVAR